MNIGLKVAGKVEFILEIPIPDLVQARSEWARVTGHLDPNFDKEHGLYFGWPIVVTKLPALQRKANPNPFQY